MNLKVPAISGALREALHLWLGGRYSPFQKILKLGRRMKLGQFPSACCQAFPSTPSVALRAFPLRMTWDIGSRDFSLRAGSLLLRVARGLCCFALVAGLSQQSSWAQQAQLPSLQINFGSDGSYSVPLQILILMTLLTFVPAMVMSMTEFTRIIIVAHFLRQALGTQAAPSNQILIGLSLFLTLFIMGPVLDQIYDDAILPYQEEQLSQSDALAKASIPLRNFMLSHVREDDLALLIKIAKLPRPKDGGDLDLRVIIPAFMLSELKTSFTIGFVLFLPFLVIDMVIASVLLSMGMIQLPPIIISTPFKILLFVLVDGWNLVVGNLVGSFYK